jgi:hypothetical protein
MRKMVAQSRVPAQAPSGLSPFKAADDTDYTDGAIVVAFIRVIHVIHGFKFLKRYQGECLVIRL